MLIPYEECRAVWDNHPYKLNQLIALDRLGRKTGYNISKHKNQILAHFRRYKEEEVPARKQRGDYNRAF